MQQRCEGTRNCRQRIHTANVAVAVAAGASGGQSCGRHYIRRPIVPPAARTSAVVLVVVVTADC